MRPLVLIYHSVPKKGCAGVVNAAAFERHLIFLKQNCSFIAAAQYQTARGSLRRPSVLLTFDDGLRNNAEVVAPILRRLQVPAVFFISSRHCVPGEYLWFTYLRMLDRFFSSSGIKLNGVFIAMQGEFRKKGIQELTARLLELRPHPTAMYDAIAAQLPKLEEFVPGDVLRDECDGMRVEQVRELGDDPLFTVGGHTLDHPYLTRCDSNELRRQVWENKIWLENLTQRRCDLFAYPLGDFNEMVLQQCRQLEFQQAFATEWGRHNSRFATRRVGIYRGTLALLHLKVRCGHWLPVRMIHATRKFSRALARAAGRD